MGEELTQQLPNDILRQILARLDSMDARFDRMETRLDSMDARLDRVEKEIGAMRRWFRQTFFEMGRDHDSLEERVENIEGRLSSQ